MLARHRATAGFSNREYGYADLEEVVKAIRMLAPKTPQIVASLASNQNLVDNYIKVSND